MANKLIIYPNNDGGISIIHPLNDNKTIRDIALKCVPTDKPFKYISESDLPSDKTFRDAWEADFANPDGYGEK